MRVDTLTIDAVVTESFYDTLSLLEEQLEDVADAQRAVDENMDIDVDVDGLGELSALQGHLAAIEAMDLGKLNSLDDISIGTATATGDGGGVTATSDGGATADGGSDDSMSRLMKAMMSSTAFGDAFDPDALVNRADRTVFPRDLVEGNLTDYIDGEELFEALADPDSPITEDVIENLGDEGEDFFDALDILDEEGVTTLPTRRRRVVNRIPRIGDRADDAVSTTLKAFENFDATTLNNLRASLFPLLITFVGALPAAIAGVVALGGAALAAAGTLGAVGALGALGVALADGQSLSDVAEGLRESFKNAFGPIAEALRPTFLAAVDSVEQFLNRLGDRANVLRAFSDELLAALDAAERFALGGLSNVVAFAAASEQALLSMLAPLEGTSITRVLAGVLADTLPLLRRLFGTIVAALPAIFNLSWGFLAVAGAVLTLFTGFLNLINTFPLLSKFLGMIIGLTLLFVTATSLAVAWTNLWASSLAQRLVGALARNLLAVGKYVAGLFGYNVATQMATVSTYAFAKAVAVLLGTVTLGIGAVAFLSGQFSALGGNIDGATKSLERFSRQQGRLSGTSFGGGNLGTNGGGGGYVDVTDSSQTIINAPDVETGTRVAQKRSYQQQKSLQHTS